MESMPLVFDGHNDSLLRFLGNEDYDFKQRNPTGHLDLPRAREGHLGGGFFAVFVPSSMEERAAMYFGTELSPTYALKQANRISANLFRIERQNPADFRIVRKLSELSECLHNDIFAAIYHFEGADPIDADLDALEVYHAAGLRSLGIVWSRPNVFAHGVPIGYGQTPDHGPGLTEAGVALVRACNQLGILIDLSHLNEAGFWDVARLSEAPLVATHSNVHAICPISRNLTDAQLDAIAASDGVVGLNFAVSFLHPDGLSDTAQTSIATMVQHIDYLVERIGIDRVAFGSDFDGADIPDELGDASGLPKLLSALRSAGYGDSDLSKIAHENWLRVLSRTWKE